jgi:hypothetical protein
MQAVFLMRLGRLVSGSAGIQPNLCAAKGDSLHSAACDSQKVMKKPKKYKCYGQIIVFSETKELF